MYQSSVYENASVGDIALTLAASDKDAGQFGRVRYKYHKFNMFCKVTINYNCKGLLMAYLFSNCKLR